MSPQRARTRRRTAGLGRASFRGVGARHYKWASGAWRRPCSLEGRAWTWIGGRGCIGAEGVGEEGAPCDGSDWPDIKSGFIFIFHWGCCWAVI